MISLRPVTKTVALATLGLSLVSLLLSPAYALPPVKQEDGKYFDKDGDPTYSVEKDGTTDWYTYSGFRRYHSECHVCHGPDGMGSTYAPALTDSLKTMSYGKFLEVVAAGIKQVGAAENLVMPAFGDNKNVVCYIDDLYIYLKARADDVVPRGRPAKHAEKPEAAKTFEEGCMK